jgi:hypothetical protein
LPSSIKDKPTAARRHATLEIKNSPAFENRIDEADLQLSTLVLISAMKLQAALLIGLTWSIFTATTFANGRLVLNVVDRDTGRPLAVRMHLKNAQGKIIKPPGVPVNGDHFVFYDRIELKLPNGGYAFLIERGSEYLERTGRFDIANFADDTKTVDLKRFVDMAKEGWYSGDLDVQRPEKDLKLLMQADDVHAVPLITWGEKKNPWLKQPSPKEPIGVFDGTFLYSLLGGEWTTPGNTVRLFRLDKPLGSSPENNLKSALGSLPLIPLVETARREQGVWIDAGAFFARDLPFWIAAGQIDSIQLMNRHLEREGVVGNEAGGFAREASRLPNPLGNGRWSQEIYYHLLNCGRRIPATAGSGSGANGNPVGYNRVYVHLDKENLIPGQNVNPPAEVTWDNWWNALRAGRAMVTNGPLLRANVENQLPGHVFQGDAGKPMELFVALTLSTRDKIRYLEIVKDGKSEIEANLEQFKAAAGKLPPVKFTESGWFLVRAAAENSQTNRYASTLPFFVEIGYQPRISRGSVKFFLDWTNKRAGEIAAATKNDTTPAAETARLYVEKSQKFWQDLAAKANVD